MSRGEQMRAFLTSNSVFIPIVILSVIFLLLDVLNIQLERFNLWVRHIINRTRQIKIKKLMVFTHQYNDFVPGSTQILFFSALLGFIWKDWKSGLFLCAAMVLQTTIITLNKKITFRARPPHVSAHKIMTSGSYPSGHSAATMTLALLGPYFLSQYIPLWATAAIFIYFFANALLTAYGRLYLDMHWATDVVGGWIISALAFMCVIYLIQWV
jgi:membrane-associated phospholipid phosphatase